MAVKSNNPLKEDEISLRDVILKVNLEFRFLMSKWKWILLFAVVGVIGGLSYTALKDTEYTASISFVTDSPKDHSSGLGSYAGLASQFGINLGSMDMSSTLFSGDNIFDLMTTRLMLQRTLLTPVVINGRETLLIDRYIELEQLKEKYPAFKKITFHSDTSSLSPAQNGAIKKICSDLVADITYTGGSLSVVTFTSKGEAFSQQFLEMLIKNVGQFYIATQTQKTRDNIDVLQKQLDSVRTQLYGAMGNVASFQDLNQNLVRQEPRVQQQKSSLKVNVNSAIYQQLVAGLESAKMTLLKETPLFEIIDEPLLPLDRVKPSMVILGIVGAVLGILLSAGFFLFRQIYREIMTSEG